MTDCSDPYVKTRFHYVQVKEYILPSSQAGTIEKDHRNLGIYKRQDRCPSRRVRPYPLVLHPTALGYAYELWGSAAVWDVPSVLYVGTGYMVPDHWYPVVSATTYWETKLRLKIKSVSVNIGETVAEYKQTASMFHDAVASLWKIYRDVRHGNVWQYTSAWDALEHLSAARLAASYGLGPLMRILGDSVLKLQQPENVNPLRRYVVTARGEIEGTYDHLSSPLTSYYKEERSDRAIVYVKYNTNIKPFIFGNPLELGWELIPFSFLLDRLVPVGDFLSAIDAMSGVDSVVGTLTTRVTRTMSVRADDHHKVTGKYREIGHSRQVLTSIPMPKLPTYRPSVSLSAVITDVALLAQLVTSHRKSKP